MSSLQFAKSIFVSTQQSDAGVDPHAGCATKVAPNRLLVRRGLAEVIDRALPLPFVALLFPRWAVVVFLYHFFCDGSPGRRSVGKWLWRVRVVDAETGSPCQLWQAIARRLGAAASQTAWFLWRWMPFVLAYELLSVVCVLLDPAGRRPEDFIAGTRVVTERQFRQARKVKGRSE